MLPYVHAEKHDRAPQDLSRRIGLEEEVQSPFSEIVLVASQLDWTRDPFDRIIVAHAKASTAPLLTKDETLLRHYEDAFWE